MVVFRFLILKFNYKTPGREDEEEEDIKLYSKNDYKEKGKETISASEEISNKDVVTNASKAEKVLEALGGKDNIVDITNCATRLRVSVKNESFHNKKDVIY